MVVEFRYEFSPEINKEQYEVALSVQAAFEGKSGLEDIEWDIETIIRTDGYELIENPTAELRDQILTQAEEHRVEMMEKAEERFVDL